MENLAVNGSGPKDIFGNTDFICCFTDFNMYLVETNDTDAYINKVLENERNLPYELKKLPLPKERIVFLKMVKLDGLKLNKGNVKNLVYKFNINKMSFTYLSRTYEITFDYDDIKTLALYIKKIFNYDITIG